MEDLTFHLEGVVRTREETQNFDGPLALILMLLSKNRIEIRDIQISLILEQYLDYIARMREMDLEVASEFVQMASHLVYIKTRTLLAGEQEVSELEQLMSSLERLRCKDAYVAIGQILPAFSEATTRGLRLFTKPPEPARLTDPAYSLSGEELFGALAPMLLRFVRAGEAEESAPLMPPRIVYGVREKSRQIIDRLRERGAETLKSLFASCESRSELVATFLSVLELCGMGNLMLTGDSGEIVVSFAGGDVEEILEAMEEGRDAAEGA